MTVERAVPAARPRSREIVKDFSPEQLKAPFVLRCGAMLIDYMLLVAIPVTAVLLGKLGGTGSDTGFQETINNTGWVIAILLVIANMFILPGISGQSIGKMITGIRIVSIDGSPASPKAILLRNGVGYLITLLTGGLGFLISLFGASGRALQDYVGGTIVVYGRRRVLR